MTTKNNLYRQLFLYATFGGLAFFVDVGILYLVKPYLGLYFGRLLSFAAAVPSLLMFID